MGSNPDPEGSDGFDWDTEDEQDILSPSCSSPRVFGKDAVAGFEEASSSAGPSSKLVSHFVGMGFSRNMVSKAIEENGEGNTEAILETLLTYSALEKSPSKREHVYSDSSSSESAGDILDDLSDEDYLGNEENDEDLSEEERTLKHLVDMGYPPAEASIAMERCGPEASIMELTDFICAAQMAKAADALLSSNEEEQRKSYFHSDPRRDKKKRSFIEDHWERKRQKKLERRRLVDEDEETTRLPNPMIGFGIPAEPWRVHHRTLPEGAIGPPYFYYENVALAPKGVWSTISRFLYEIEPEFVDSKFFCAAARKRGYIHNLPINNRFPLLPIPPQTIHEALPITKKWWPSWDHRTKLNCLQTCTASAKLTDRIRKALEDWDDEPPLRIQKYVVDECKKWNLVWVGRNKVAPLEPDEIETLLGFPKNHTRGGGISRTERLKGLGNSFQVDTVAYHLSVLKDMFPSGMSVLSLFSGIGGAEVALHRLGIPLKIVVSVEISETSRNILRSWWEQTNQKGTLIDIDDVQKLDADRLEQLINSFGGFDLIVGGSPCNNISGSNRVSRDGLEGKHSSLFYDYFRILNQVKVIMGKS
ncbi:C-5 cytosine methyltransferase [Macleaya cordata]|uniref:DNA (cytosine-5-)-methyltransferase n=1 Tax=Macleaya cordata TaxID=56857 RepID=A0A200R2T2_MACCD|nr:C-5 cytosine methyltransferase [Macleaya cordata]